MIQLRRIINLIAFIGYYIFEMVKANLILARDILSKNPGFKPGIVKIELEAKTDQEILLLANLISMTPGSLCMHISEDKSAIYVHDMYVSNPDEVKHKIKHDLEKRILAFTR